MYIESIKSREVLDSRGCPTVETDIFVKDIGFVGRGSVPSGASKGKREAVEKRDGGDRYNGLGVREAVEQVISAIAPALRGLDIRNQEEIDTLLLELDGTEDKSRLGANALLSVSLAVARGGARVTEVPLYRYIGGLYPFRLPVPMMNLLNGGCHGDNALQVQEFLVIPQGGTFSECLRCGVEVFTALGDCLKSQGLSVSVGDEGGYAPPLKRTEEALDFLMAAIEKSGYKAGEEVYLGLDVAASTLYEKGIYHLEGKKSVKELIGWYSSLCEQYPLVSIEDGCAEEDEEGWCLLMERLGDKIKVIGDDVFVTKESLLCEGLRRGIANGILIKPNQCGTLTETLGAISKAHKGGWICAVSHRSGETNDSFIADLSVGTGSDFIKAGAPCRGERVSKYNTLLRIEEELSTPQVRCLFPKREYKRK